MKGRKIIKVFSLVIALSLLCAAVLSGCGVKKKAPEELISSAMTTSVSNFEERSSLDEALGMLKKGLLSVGIDITFYGETTSMSGYYMDKQIVLDVGLKDKLGIDLGRLKEKFPKSIFGTEGANVADITKEEEQQLLDSVGKIIDAAGITDLSDDAARIIKENSTLKAEYGKKVDLASGTVKADIVDLSMTGAQIKNALESIGGRLSELFKIQGENAPFDFDFDIDEADEDKVLLEGRFYTDVKSGEFLGGWFKTVPSEDGEEPAEVNIDVNRTDSTAEFIVKINADGEQNTVGFHVSDLNDVELINITADNEPVFELEINRAAKAVVLRAFGEQVLRFEYTIERAADNSVKSFSATFTFTDDGMEGMGGGMFGSIFALPFLGNSSYGYGYDDYEDYDDYDYGYDYDYDDYDYEPEPTEYKITLTYEAEGSLPAYKDILDLSLNDIDALLSGMFMF